MIFGFLKFGFCSDRNLQRAKGNSKIENIDIKKCRLIGNLYNMYLQKNYLMLVQSGVSTPFWNFVDNGLYLDKVPNFYS